MPTLILAALALAFSQTPQMQTAAIHAAKNSVVRDIDTTLPPVTFEAWLQGLVGAQTALKWGVTDCGEQTGTPADRGRDVPMCAEVNVNLPGNRVLSLALLAGSMARGLTTGPLRLYSGAIIEPTPKPITWIKTLSQVPGLVGQPIAAAPGGTEPRVVSHPPGAVELVARHSGKCLDATGDPNRMVPATQQACSGTLAQQWSLMSVTGGFEIVSWADQRFCLNLRGATRAQGALVWLSTCTMAGRPGETWNLQSTVDDTTVLIATHSSMCLDVSQESTSNGAAILQYPCHGTQNEMWTMRPVSSPLSPATVQPQMALRPSPTEPVPLQDQISAKPTIAAFYFAGRAAPSFSVECRNVSGRAQTIGPGGWMYPYRIDGVEPSGGRGGGSGTRFQLEPDGIWRGILVLMQPSTDTSGTGPTPSGVRTTIFLSYPLAAGRHTVAVRCADSWSDDFVFFWQPPAQVDGAHESPRP